MTDYCRWLPSARTRNRRDNVVYREIQRASLLQRRDAGLSVLSYRKTAKGGDLHEVECHGERRGAGKSAHDDQNG